MKTYTEASDDKVEDRLCGGNFVSVLFEYVDYGD